jgi:hypothetical protein
VAADQTPLGFVSRRPPGRPDMITIRVTPSSPALRSKKSRPTGRLFSRFIGLRLFAVPGQEVGVTVGRVTGLRAGRLEILRSGPRGPLSLRGGRQ